MHLATPHRKTQPVKGAGLAEGLDQTRRRDRAFLIHKPLTPEIAVSRTSASFQRGRSTLTKPPNY